MAAALHQRVEDDEPAVSASRASSAIDASASAAGAARPDADQHDLLELQLAVLDLGDVGELGGQAGNPAQRQPVGEVLFTDRRLGRLAHRRDLEQRIAEEHAPIAEQAFRGVPARLAPGTVGAQIATRRSVGRRLVPLVCHPGASSGRSGRHRQLVLVLDVTHT